MEVLNNVVYGSVIYPKDVKEIYQYAKANFLDGYSAQAEDGRHFRWVESLNKPEVTDTEIVLFEKKSTEDKAIVSVAETPSLSVKIEDNVSESSNVKNIKQKLINYRNKVADLEKDKQELTKSLATKEAELDALKKDIKNLKEVNLRLQADIDEIAAL